jgi:hypothetical protein
MRLVELRGRAAVDALHRREVDVMMTFAPFESPLVHDMLAAPDVRLMSFAQAPAYARRFPALWHVVLPKGVLDLRRRLPRADLHLLAATTNLVVRDTPRWPTCSWTPRWRSTAAPACSTIRGSSPPRRPRTSG